MEADGTMDSLYTIAGMASDDEGIDMTQSFLWQIQKAYISYIPIYYYIRY